LSIASFITSELMNQVSVTLFCFIYAEVALDTCVSVVASLSDIFWGALLSVCFVFRLHFYTLGWDVTGSSFSLFVSYHSRHCHIGHSQEQRCQNLDPSSFQ